MATILLVDDDVALLERIATYLGEAGYTVLRANRVQYAEMLLAEQRPDLVILDPDTSNSDGWVLISVAASIAPVLLISGQGLEEDIIRGLDAGAVDYLTKPFGTAELLARVRARLRERNRVLAEPAAPPATGVTEQLGSAASSSLDAAQPASEPAQPLPAPIKPAVPNVLIGQAARRGRRGARAPGDEAEPVFMPYGEEERILRDGRVPATEDLGDISQLPLGQRLHAARQRKRLTLVQAELETHPSVPMHYIQAMEEEKFSLLPRGPVAEELLKTYAAYVGLDLETALDEYRRLHFITPSDPPMALGGAPAPRRLPSWLISLVAATLALAIGCGAIALYDPGSMRAFAQRAGLVAIPPSATPTATAQPTATATATLTPSPSPTATLTPSPSPTATPQATATATPSPSATPRR